MICTVSKLLAVAAAEIGYLEKASNSQLDSKTANAGSGNWTKYARDFDEKYPNWYNGKKNGYAWCDMFVDWCFLTAFGYKEALRLTCQPEKNCGAGCEWSMRYYKEKGQLYKSPKPGDQIFFGTSAADVSHTGIVEKVDSKSVHTIEGNASNQVMRKSYLLTYAKILGYGRPKYDAEVTPEAAKPTKTVEELAREVIDDKWGVGEDRKKRLTGAGYSYTAVQAKVNEMLRWTPAVGDVVIFSGARHYSSSDARTGPTCRGGKARVTKIAAGTRHPYHLIRIAGQGATVYGWVDAGTFIKA